MIVTIAGRTIELDRTSVERALAGVLPDPIREHYVVIRGRKYPPKQVLGEVTGLDRADFTTHQARRILQRLGFTAARARAGGLEPAQAREQRLPYGGRQAEALSLHRGQWVALGEPTEVLVAADALEDVVRWLNRHGLRSSGILRVPERLAEAEGLAPL